MQAGFRIDLTDGVARVVMDLPERHNAFDEVLISGPGNAFVDLDGERCVDRVVLGAAGSSFSAGTDLGWMKRAAVQNRAASFVEGWL